METNLKRHTLGYAFFYWKSLFSSHADDASVGNIQVSGASDGDQDVYEFSGQFCQLHAFRERMFVLIAQESHSAQGNLGFSKENRSRHGQDDAGLQSGRSSVQRHHEVYYFTQNKHLIYHTYEVRQIHSHEDIRPGGKVRAFTRHGRGIRLFKERRRGEAQEACGTDW